MAYRRLNLFDAAAWSVRAPDDTPSLEMVVSNEAALTRFGEGTSLKLEVTSNAEGHRAERALPGEDLSAENELRLWMNSTRVGDGKSGRPLYLELRMASAAVDFDDAGNTWARLLPIRQANTWEMVSLAIDDVPDAVRSDVRALRLTCVDESLAFTCYLDSLYAAREEMIRDVETALIERLDGIVNVGGDDVEAVLYHSPDDEVPDPPSNPQRPQLRIRPLDYTSAEPNARQAGHARDFSESNVRLGARHIPYALIYALDPFTDDRDHEAALLEALLAAFVPRGTLVAGGMPLSVEWLGATADEFLGERISPRIRVLTRLRVRETTPFVPVQEITLTVDQPSVS